MFYALLVIPHLLVLGALLWVAYRSSGRGQDEGENGASDDGGGLRRPPLRPGPLPRGGDGMPLPVCDLPARRLRAGERLADLHPLPARRQHPPVREPARR
jgi:hypothetical protein